jgi:hypothetical protein
MYLMNHLYTLAAAMVSPRANPARSPAAYVRQVIRAAGIAVWRAANLMAVGQNPRATGQNPRPGGHNSPHRRGLIVTAFSPMAHLATRTYIDFCPRNDAPRCAGRIRMPCRRATPSALVSRASDPMGRAGPFGHGAAPLTVVSAKQTPRSNDIDRRDPRPQDIDPSPINESTAKMLPFVSS